MITTEADYQFMVIQDFDRQMIFQSKDAVQIVYLSSGIVRIDKQR